MSKSKQESNSRPTPTLTEIETLLFNTKPQPTARLRHKLRQAPWQSQQGEVNMIQLKKLEFVTIGLAVLLLALIAAVVLPRWSAARQTVISSEPDSGSAGLNQSGSNQSQGETTPAPTPVPIGGTMAWQVTGVSGDSSALLQWGAGIAYAESGAEGRLFVADGRQGIQVFSGLGEHLNTISIHDPETDQPVFVHDVVWSQLLWLGPPEYGLIALSDPFETGQYLHVVNPDNGAILNSFEPNNNIAIQATTEPVSETLPTKLTLGADGELYTYRTFNFAPDTPEQPATSLLYLLRMIMDGRILNPILVGERAVNDMPANIISALAYQNVTGHVYAAAHQGTHGVVQKYNLVGNPEALATLDEELIRWQENVALSTDNRGHLFIFIDTPALIIEMDQADQIVNVYGFRDMAADANYPSISQWLPGRTGQPLAMTLSPDGSTLFLIDKQQDQINLTAFELAGSGQ